MSWNPLEPLLLKLADLQVRRPWLVVLMVALSLLPAGYAASRLELKTAFSELLPSDKPSVIELRRIESRLAGSSTLTVAAEGTGNVQALKTFVDRVSPRIKALGPEYVGAVDDGSRAVRAFFEKNKHLYADTEDLQKLRDDIVARYDYEVGKESGLDLGVLDEEDAPPEVTADAIEKRFSKKVEEAKKSDPGVDGYYIGEDGKLAAILVRTQLSSGDERAFELRKKIEAIIDEEKPHFGDPGMTFGFTGNLITSAEQHRAIKSDLTEVGAWGIGLILTVVFLFFLRLRTLWAMTLTAAVGCIWAFAMAKLTVGYLNTATGFLASIIAGNGINFGIIYMARFIEARRDERLVVSDAIRVSTEHTYLGTLAASGAAMIAYGSLAITDFRGFKHFGIIAGAGMLLCWVATYTFLPAFLVISERVRPMFHQREAAWRTRIKGIYGYPFAMLARRFPRALAIVGLSMAVAGVVMSVLYFVDDPMEYDLANIKNEQLTPTSAGRLSTRVDKIVGRLGQDGRAILTERLDQVQPLVTELERRREAAPADNKPFSKVVSIFDLLPKDQEKKLTLLRDIKDRVDRARKRDFISDEDWKKLEPHLPKKLEPIGIDELPEQVARPFTEQDGTRGRIVFIAPTEKKSVYDAHYLMAWADSFRHVELPNGEVILGTGDPVIFSDMLINIAEDAPKATALSLFGTILVIVLAFRGRAGAWLSLGTLLIGMSWLISFLYLMKIKLNFLNFVAIPVAIGIGADYAINVMKRREIDGPEHLYRVLVQTGGAVVLCSMTTAGGYIALLLSVNRAVKSFGLAGAVGELATLFSSMLILPALLFWHARATGLMAVPASTRPRVGPDPESQRAK